MLAEDTGDANICGLGPARHSIVADLYSALKRSERS